MLKPIDKSEFDIIYAIMTDSFPPDERKSYEAQFSRLDDEIYEILTLRDDNNTIQAFLATYDLGEFIFIEHFAVDKSFRNGGLGSAAISELISYAEDNNKRICLEVELPTGELEKRRVRFYERNGFTLNDYEYFLPPQNEGDGYIPMKIMTTGGSIDKDTFVSLEKTLYSRVYNCNTLYEQ